jgi:NADPH-dependent 2,4-dienoyl-CoA reductase/sulfur reductase-like enzyme
MQTNDNESSFGVDRRDFLKTAAGLGVAALAMPGIPRISNAEAASIKDISDEIIETDVLVIGGGYAGVLAAIKAKD